MIAWLSNWAQGIIVALVIATIIEMVLPNGNIKKYIKVIIGIYIVFAIISPIIDKFFSNKVDINDIYNVDNYTKQMEEASAKVYKKLESNNNRTVKDIYVENLENDIKNKLKAKDYKVNNILIKVKDDDNYTIEEISIEIEKIKEENKENKENNNIKINQISIENSIKSTLNTGSEINKLSDEDKKKIKDYLKEVYSIEEKIIKLN